jgi:hypothetical protein
MIARKGWAWVILLAFVALPAAAEDLAKALQGKWKLDKLAALEATAPDSYKNATPEERAAMREQVLTMMPDMICEIGTDHFEIKAPNLNESVSYVVKKVEGRTVWIETTETKKDGTVEKLDFSAELLGADTLKLTKKDEPISMVFNREK